MGAFGRSAKRSGVPRSASCARRGTQGSRTGRRLFRIIDQHTGRHPYDRGRGADAGQRPEHHCRLAGGASWILALALLVMLVRAGTGPWVVWCAVAMAASCAATALCTGSPTGLSIQPPRAAVAIAVAALVAAVCGSCSGPDTDYPGVWTASKGSASLTLTEQTEHGQGGQYTLRVGTCAEQGRWAFDYPQMSTSVAVGGIDVLSGLVILDEDTAEQTRLKSKRSRPGRGRGRRPPGRRVPPRPGRARRTGGGPSR